MEIALIEVNNNSLGAKTITGSAEAIELMQRRARELGANALIRVVTVTGAPGTLQVGQTSPRAIACGGGEPLVIDPGRSSRWQ